MTKGENGKSKMFGRLIFGEKRKQPASPSRHRSSTRNRDNATDVKSPSGGAGSAGSKDPINIHDWAVWRMHLNEQMGSEMTDQMAQKQIRQFLQSNPFYQQHSRDPSNGRYTGVRLLFSIPHAKLQPELKDGSQGLLMKNAHTDIGETRPCDQNNAHSNIDDRSTSAGYPLQGGLSMLTDKMISQYLPKKLTGNTGGFLQVDENMIAADTTRTRRSMRASYTAADAVHSTLQKAVKDGNVLEKIKAFEMQAAAVQAELTPKLGRSNHMMSNRMQKVTSSLQSTAHSPLSPPMLRSNPYPISPIPIQYESQQQQSYIRSHRSRHVHPVQHRHDGHLAPMIGRESRKGAHVLEPAHGDIILKRRTPSQRTVNDEDYSMSMMSSMAPTISQNHHHHRASASRSRHRQDTAHEKRSSSHNDHVHKKHAQKQKETTTTPSTNKTSTRSRWLIGRKQTTTENGKQDISATKSGKTEKNKKKNNEKERVEASKKATSPDSKGEQLPPTFDDNDVYDVPKTITNNSITAEAISPQFPARIDEENESDQEEKSSEDKTNPSPTKDEVKLVEDPKREIILTTNVIKRSNKTKNHPRLQSTDGEIISKTDDDTRFSRPTDDHAHRSDLNDEDDEYKSDGDVFIEDSSLMNATQQQISHCSVEAGSSDRRWQWSKESGGLIEKGNGKKKVIPTIVITDENQSNEDEEERMIYEVSHSQKNHSSSMIIPNERNCSKQLLHAMINSKKLHQEQQPTTDEFFENGPYSNPDETIGHVTSSA